MSLISAKQPVISGVYIIYAMHSDPKALLIFIPNLMRSSASPTALGCPGLWKYQPAAPPQC